MKRKIPIFVLIVLICVIAYGNSLRNDFTYDDAGMMDEELFSNIHDLNSFLTMDYYRFSGEMTFRPLVTLTYFFDFLFWYFLPFGFHLTNLLWHAAAVTVVYLLLRRLLKAPLPALLGGIIFAIHPVQTEAVNAVGFREDLMCAFFFLMSLFLFIQMRQGGITGAGENQRRVSGAHHVVCYAISLLCFLMALLSKEMAATLPLIFIVHDLLFLSPPSPRAGFKKAVRVYAGYALVALAYLILRYVLFYNPSEQAVGYVSGRLPARLGAIPQIFSLYLRLFIFPVGLSVEYDDSVIRPFISFESFAAMAVTGLFVALIFLLWRKNRLACFALLFILISLLPVLNVVPICNMLAERYVYLPCFGVAILSALLLDALAHARGKRVAVLISVLIFILYGNATIERNNVWRNSLALWTDGVRKAPESARAHLNLGVALGDKDDVTGAIAQYEESIRLRPTSPDGYNNLGLIYFSKNKIEKAIEYYRKSIEVDPMQVRGYMNLALALIQKGEKEEGARIVEKLVEIKPLNAPLKCNLGNIYVQSGQYEKAAEQFNAALGIKPYSFEALLGLGKLYFQRGQWEQAAAYFERACGSHGASYVRSISMGNVYYARGLSAEPLTSPSPLRGEGKGEGGTSPRITDPLSRRFLEQAEAEYKKAVALKPRLAEGYNNLGLVYQKKKDYAGAARSLKKALECEPGNPTILLNLAEVSYLNNKPPEGRDYVMKIFQSEKIPEQVSLDLARFYYRNRLYQEAIDVYRKILDRRAEYGWGYFHVARAYALLGEPDQAALWLNKGAQYLTAEQMRAIEEDSAFVSIAVRETGKRNE